jgi:hypothetical protein
VGSVLRATTGVNLRQGPSTNDAVILVVADGALVTVINSPDAQNGFYNVSYGGVQGFTYASYYDVAWVPGQQTSNTHRDQALLDGEIVTGFSYWWGHGRFDPGGAISSNTGTCSGNCPSCTHGGGYGGDCSGFVGKAWKLGNTDLTVDSHPYSTASFVGSSSNWHDVDRAALQPGDALVYNDNGEGHIFLYQSGDGWGSMWAYECKGCSYGCVHDLRTAGSAYKGIGRTGW